MHLSVFDLASPQSGQLLWLWSVCMWVCGFVLACVTIPILYIVVRYRARGAGEPPQIAGNKQLEIIRTVVPLALAGLLFVLSITAARAVDRPVTREPDLIVTGHQWWWALTYPAANATNAHEIHVPVGRNMLIGIEAADVIADFCLSRQTRTIGPLELTAPPHPTVVQDYQRPDWYLVAKPLSQEVAHAVRADGLRGAELFLHEGMGVLPLRQWEWRPSRSKRS